MRVSIKFVIPVIVLIILLTGFFIYNTMLQEEGVPEGEEAPPAEQPSELGDYTPKGVHISFIEDPRYEVVIIWVTKDKTETSVVSLTLPDGSVENYTGESVQYNDRYWHIVRITGLTPDTEYKYRVGDPSLEMSKEFVFRTAPDEIVPFTFTAYGDQGITSYASLAVERALEYEPSLHLHLGDLSYGGAKVSQWIKWFTIIEPLASKSPYMYAIGNHEYDGTGDLTDIKTYFEAPNDETNYGFIWSNVYFLTVDLGPSSSNPASQELISWVESKLIEAANNPLVQWIVVYLHYPPYSSGKAHGSSPAAQPLIPLFDKYGVDLVLAGHEHNYERTYPIRNDMVVSFNSTLYSGIEGTIYIVAGGGGGGLYKEFQSPSPEWSYYRAAEYSILVVSVDGGVMEVKAVNSQTGEIMDSFIIKKGERVSTKSYIDSELDIQLNSTYNIMMLMLTVSLSIAIHRILMAKRISRYN